MPKKLGKIRLHFYCGVDQTLDKERSPPLQLALAGLGDVISRVGIYAFGLNKPSPLNAVQVSANGATLTFKVHLFVSSDRIIQRHPIGVVAENSKANCGGRRQFLLAGWFLRLHSLLYR